MNKKYTLISGFTLVEFLLYFALVSILFLIMTELFVNLLDLKSESLSRSRLSIDAQYFPLRLEYDLEHADSIVLPAALGDTGSVLQLDIAGQNVTYSIQANSLVRTSSEGALPVLGGTTISQLEFQRLGKVAGKHTIRVTYRLTSPIQQASGSDFIEYQTTLGLR